jgi:hypothetical protein
MTTELFDIQKNGVSPFQNFLCYLGGSVIQTVADNPLTAYKQLVQQYAKSVSGEAVSPETAVKEAKIVFKNSPVSASLSGLTPRMAGVLFKSIPKFSILIGYNTMVGSTGEPGFAAATTASILSAPFINPVRMIEKQQRINMQTTGKEKTITEILKESKLKNYKPLFRGIIPLTCHSIISASLGLVGQPKLQKHIQTEIGTKYSLGQTTTNLISSLVVCPIYAIITNPLSRMVVIMQTSSISGKGITISNAYKEIVTDVRKFGITSMFRGQGIGIVKAIISITMFHEARLFLTDKMKDYNGHY